MSDQRRQPAGVPTGGEFSSNEHDEAAPIVIDPVDAYDQAGDLIFEAAEIRREINSKSPNQGARLNMSKRSNELVDRAAALMGAEQRHADRAKTMVYEGWQTDEVLDTLTPDYARGYAAAERTLEDSPVEHVIARRIAEAGESVSEDSPMSSFLNGGIRAQATALVGRWNKGYSVEKKVRAVIEASRTGSAEQVTEAARWG